MKKLSRRRTIEFIGLAVSLVVFGIVFGITLNSYNNGLVNRRLNVVPKEPNTDDFILVNITILSLDPSKDEMTTRIEFIPVGNFSSDSGFTINKDLRLFTGGNNGDQEFDFPKDRSMSPKNITFYLYGGEVSNYPFDNHKAEILLVFVDPNKEATSPGALTKFEEIPIVIALQGATPGIEVDFEVKANPSGIPPEKQGKGSRVEQIEFKIERSTTVVFFGCFLIVLFWFLGISTLLISLLIWFRKRELVPDFFGYDGALLFAIPTLRTTVPGTPPLGALIDFSAFYWSIGLVTVSLGILIFVWIFRHNWEENLESTLNNDFDKKLAGN